MPSAVASHILVSTEEQALELKQQIADGAAFADLAKEHSSAHQVLDTHFRQLEASVDWTSLVVAQKAA